MSWDHCGNTIVDTTGCPSCGISKEAWTVEFDVTREFKVQRPHSLRVEVLDGSGAPLAGEPFQVTRADGTALDGALDDLGAARVPTAAAEEASIAFPNRRAGAFVVEEPEEQDGPVDGADGVARYRWRTARKLRLRAGRTLKVVVKDARGQVVPDLEYVIVLRDGERRGRTDEHGVFCEAGLPAGDLKVRLADGRVLVFRRPPAREPEPAERDVDDEAEEADEFAGVAHHGDHEEEP